jgi:hypothetical protein
MRMKTLRLLMPLTLVLFAAACGSDSDSEMEETTQGAGEESPSPSPEAIPPPEVAFTMDDKGVTELPTEVQAGIVNVAVTNDGKDPHFIAIARVNDDSSVEEVTGALAENDFATFFSSSVVAGAALPPPGEEGVAPGDVGTVTVGLTEGSYILGDPEAKGFEYGAFEVGPAGEEEIEEPEADFEIVEGEYFIEVPNDLTAGTHTIALTNEGQQGHELIIFDKKTEEEAGFAFAPVPGQTAWFELELEPGEYTFACFFPDIQDGEMGKKDHSKLGMETTVTVE